MCEKRRSSKRNLNQARKTNPDRWTVWNSLWWRFSFDLRMDKDDRKPKTFVSTFRLPLKPRGQKCCVGKQTENGKDATNKVLKGNTKLGVTSATGKLLKTSEKLTFCFLICILTERTYLHFMIKCMNRNIWLLNTLNAMLNWNYKNKSNV